MMNYIDDYSFGRIVINGKIYTSDVIIYPSAVRSNWWRKEGHRLYIEDIKEVLDYKPEILIIGTGAYSMMKISDDVKREIERYGIKVLIKDTSEACKEFNNMISRGINVVAALHLTC